MLALLALAAVAAPRPSVVVILSVDQLRTDYVTRFESLYLPANENGRIGGFRYLTDYGANFVNARYHHIPTETGPGHAVIGTGSTPGLSGIIANTWFERATGKTMYCVTDASSLDILTGKPSMSPKNLRVTTIGDELELATNGQSKTASIAIKDRASILLAGHSADGVVWYDKSTGSWTTSDFYAPDKKLPSWAATANSWKYPDQFRGKSWEAQIPADVAAKHAFPTKAPAPPTGFGDTFPHTLPVEGFYDVWTYTPWANDFVVKTAVAAIDELGMGQDDVPDILTLNFSTNDYVGHRFGPYSPEVLELSVQTDRSISDLLNALKAKVPGGLAKVLFVLTADHGVVPVVEDMADRRIPAKRVTGEFWTDLRARLAKAMGTEAVAHIDDSLLYLDHAKLASAGVPVSKARAAAASVLSSDPHVFRAYTHEALASLPAGDAMDEAARNGFDSERSPDVVFALRPGIYTGGTGTGHGSGWAYDTAVPVIFAGPGVAQGRHMDRSGPEDIAATVAALLGIVPPSGNIGRAIGLAP